LRKASLQNFGSTFEERELRLAIGQSQACAKAFRFQALASTALLGVTFSVGLMSVLVPGQAASATASPVQPELSGAINGSLRLVAPTSAEAFVGKGVTLSTAPNSTARLVVALAPTSLLHPLSSQNSLPLSDGSESGFPRETSEDQTVAQPELTVDSSHPSPTQAAVSVVQLPLLASSLDASELVQSLSSSSSLQVKTALADSTSPASEGTEDDFANVSLVRLTPQPFADAPLEAESLKPAATVDAALPVTKVAEASGKNLVVLPTPDASGYQIQPIAEVPAKAAQQLMGEVKAQVVTQPSISQGSPEASPNTLISSLQFLPPIARGGIFPKLPNLDLPPLSPAERYLPGAGGLTTGFIWPAKGVFTSGYGQRWGRMHRGIDIAAPIGTAIVAAAAGTIVTSEWNSGGYGNVVEIRHPDGSLTLYGHNNRLIARVGEYVHQGQLISEMGSTGRSTGPHVHFEIHPPGMGAVNPMLYLSRS
jgi:murein DD-endopeptidase MepM/ murein hydrolase activator NlpD